jgi:hypothetical protein
LLPATDGVGLWLRVGTGGGPTYQADAADYQWASTGDSDSSDSEIELVTADSTGALSNAAGETSNVTVKFSNPEASKFHVFDWRGVRNAPDNTMRTTMGTGRYQTAEPITAIRFLVSSGNIASGRFSLYGLKKA